MLKTELNLAPFLPFNRENAAAVANAASRFECRLTIEYDGVVLNAKSMLGLLSQTRLPDGQVFLVADGVDEREATERLTKGLRPLDA